MAWQRKEACKAVLERKDKNSPPGHLCMASVLTIVCHLLFLLSMAPALQIHNCCSQNVHNLRVVMYSK